MNRIYRLVWNHVLNAWVAVSENAKGRGKSASARKCIVGAGSQVNVGGLVASTLGLSIELGYGQGAVAAGNTADY